MRSHSPKTHTDRILPCQDRFLIVRSNRLVREYVVMEIVMLHHRDLRYYRFSREEEWDDDDD